MRTIVTLMLTMTSVLAVGIGAGENLWAERGGNHDDGWRRTAGGWERVDGLNQPVYATSAKQSRTEAAGGLRSPGRLDGHPAVLVAFQLMAISLAFLAFPRPSPAGENVRRVTCGQPPWYVPAWIF